MSLSSVGCASNKGLSLLSGHSTVPAVVAGQVPTDSRVDMRSAIAPLLLIVGASKSHTLPNQFCSNFQHSSYIILLRPSSRRLATQRLSFLRMFHPDNLMGFCSQYQMGMMMMMIFP